MLSYGGVPLAYPTEADRTFIEERLSTDGVRHFARLDGPGVRIQGLPWMGSIKVDPLHLNALFLPVGASRWAWGLFFCTQQELDKITPQAYANGKWNPLPLVLDDGKRPPLTTKLYMLPPRPIYQTFMDAAASSSAPGMFLLTLVDARYRWWECAANLTVTPGVTTWPQLFAAIASALGITLALDTIPAAYLTPPADFNVAYEKLPVVLEAACLCVGQRLVANYDGTYQTQNASTALTRAKANLSNQGPRLAGGQFRLLTGAPNDLTAIAPTSVSVVFPSSTGAAPTVNAVTLASLVLPEYGPVTGNGTTHVIRSSCRATGSNGAQLSTLANQLATDWYRWQLGMVDERLIGAGAWTPEGLHDLEWSHAENEANVVSLRVFRGPWNDVSGDLLAYGTGGSSTVNNYYDTTQNYYTNNTVNFFNDITFNFTTLIDVTWVFNAYTYFFITGPQTSLFQFGVPVEWCSAISECCAIVSDWAADQNDWVQPNPPKPEYMVRATGAAFKLTGITPIMYTKPPTSLAVSTSVTGGVLPAAARYYKITSYLPSGESHASNEATVTSVGATSSNTLTWTAASPQPEGYRVYVGTSAGAENVLVADIQDGTVVTYTHTGNEITSAGSPPTTNGTYLPQVLTLFNYGTYPIWMPSGSGSSTFPFLFSGSLLGPTQTTGYLAANGRWLAPSSCATLWLDNQTTPGTPFWRDRIITSTMGASGLKASPGMVGQPSLTPGNDNAWFEDATWSKTVVVYVNDALIGRESRINCIAGTNMAITGFDDTGEQTIDLTFDAAGAALSSGESIQGTYQAVTGAYASVTGISISLPSAGTYLLTAKMDFTAASNSFVQDTCFMEMYDSTNTLEIPGTKDSILYFAQLAVNTVIKSSGCMTKLYTTTGAATVVLRASVSTSTFSVPTVKGLLNWVKVS